MKKNVLDFSPSLATGFVAEQEGFSETAYLCPAGVWTIGYGHTQGVMAGDKMTMNEALETLELDLNAFQKDLATIVKVPLTVGMFVALMSFIYNFGVAKCRGYTLFKLLNQGKYKEASSWFPKYCSPNTPYEKGLKARRLREQAMFERDGFYDLNERTR